MTFETSGGIFVCPICQNTLLRRERSLVCERRHTFDIAKEGHVNLLRTAGSLHGDNRQMVLSRRAFLEKGYYSHLKEALTNTIASYVKNGALLDSGCGEGYYTEGITSLPNLSVYGIDISSRAAALAAKKPNIKGVAVASAYALPVASGSCDAVMNIFSPFCREEFERVLKSGGYLFNIIPAEKHLWELKAAVYDKPYENKLNPIETEGFRFVEKVAIEKTITLPSQEDIAALMMMTPYFYRTSREGHQRAEALTSIDITASFYLLVYQKL
ncbi:MAG: methyltransferase domain-containing protein [Clostridia bacterium]|nr:methyltransferase domain-containing protein [Clostridia bacterium]